jgi:hypothetical protein
MIIMIGGVPCSGKSTLTKKIISGLGSAEYVEPMKLFKCQVHNDILVVGQYPEGETFGGTDKLSYGTINKFREFINQEQPKYKHIIVEGDRFFRSKDIEWLVETHDAKVFVLTVDSEEEHRRHKERNDTQSEAWLSGRRSQISNILTNFALMGKLEVRTNDSNLESQNLKNEIEELL